MDKVFLSELYRKMSEGELLSIMSNDYNDLSEEAKGILTEELRARGLANGIEKVIEVQTTDISDDALNYYIEMIRNMKCPICSNTDNKLNGVLLLNDRYTEYVIGCPDCLDKVLGDATGGSIGLGLLGGVGGVVKSISNIAKYRKILTQIQANEPSESLISFIKKRIGEIELNKGNVERLERMIKHPNATEY